MTSRPERRGAGSGWLAGLVLGVLVGVTTISFALGLLGLPILLTSLGLILWKGPRAVALAGLMTGWGLMWTVAIGQSTIACLTFERGPGRWCEPGDVGPFLLFGAGLFAAGLVVSALAFRRHVDRQDP